MNIPILIVTPFRNESHSISQYLKSLKEVDYPKELIDLYWLENDSTDETLSMLKAAKDEMPFKSTTLKSVNILGPRPKRTSGKYFKDVSHGKKRRRAWLVIWNKYFIPLITKTNHKYILFWYADAVAPPNVITDYLKVFDEYPAGWVGGKMRRRFPRQNDITSPRLIGYTRLPTKKKKRMTEKERKKHHMKMATQVKEINTAIEKINKITEVKITMHVFMIPRKPLCSCKLSDVSVDIHLSLIDGLAKQELKVYYQPSVYLEHVSTDGKIWG